MSKKTDVYFSYKQLKAIKLLALGTITHTEIAREVGVNINSITRWKKDPKFMHAVIMESRKLLGEELPAVYKSLAAESKTGSAQHIKILLDHLADLDKANQHTATITFVWEEEKKEDDSVG